MKRSTLMIIVILSLTMVACGGMKKSLNMYGKGDIEFPNGTVLGGASTDQAQALAQILVDSHNMQMQAISEMKEKHLQSAEKALRILEEVAKSQGSGEITIFFDTGTSGIAYNSLEYNRLIRFVDYVSRESRGRKVHFVLVGSASSVGGKTVNQRLSDRRANAPVDVIDKYLVNVPHDFYKVGGVGEMYSPEKGRLEGKPALSTCPGDRFLRNRSASGSARRKINREKFNMWWAPHQRRLCVSAPPRLGRYAHKSFPAAPGHFRFDSGPRFREDTRQDPTF